MEHKNTLVMQEKKGFPCQHKIQLHVHYTTSNPKSILLSHANHLLQSSSPEVELEDYFFISESDN